MRKVSPVRGALQREFSTPERALGKVSTIRGRLGRDLDAGWTQGGKVASNLFKVGSDLRKVGGDLFKVGTELFKLRSNVFKLFGGLIMHWVGFEAFIAWFMDSLAGWHGQGFGLQMAGPGL